MASPTLALRYARLDQRIEELSRAARLETWNSFVEELKVPADMLPALMTMRPELLRLLQPKTMSAEEVAVLYTLIAGLMETNTALRAHAQQVSSLAADWASMMRGITRQAYRIEHFAAFRKVGDSDD